MHPCLRTGCHRDNIPHIYPCPEGSRGCSILSTGRIPKSNAVGLHCAEKWGFHPVQEDAESVTFEKNFEYDEGSCWKRLQEVIGN